MAEGTRLLSEYGDQYSIAGSNPALSVRLTRSRIRSRKLDPVCALCMRVIRACCVQPGSLPRGRADQWAPVRATRFPPKVRQFAGILAKRGYLTERTESINRGACSPKPLSAWLDLTEAGSAAFVCCLSLACSPCRRSAVAPTVRGCSPFRRSLPQAGQRR